jgi:protein-S-isoprenylcysteine O-methyltransferase Ste14
MTPLPFVLPYAALFWAAFLWAYLPESRLVRRARRAQTATDSRSLQVITLVQGLAFSGAFALAGRRALQFAPAHLPAAFFSGVALVVAGSLLRRHCFRTLGASFTGDVRARADQEVVSRGAYRFVRHPSYTAGIVLNAGVGLALGSWASLLLLVAATFGSYLYRMTVEERTLLSVIGEPYREFMRTRKRLIPFVY